jgi:tetratricopeptide (TPR) repeat protein
MEVPMGKFCTNKIYMIFGIIPAAMLMISGCTSGKKASLCLNTVSNFERCNTSAEKPDSSDNSSYYHFLKSQLYKKNNNIDKALYHIAKAAILDPDSITIIRDYAAMLILEKRYEESVILISNALKKTPDSKDLLKTLAGVRLAMKQEDKAANIYMRLIELDPKDKNLFYILGGLYTEKKEYDKAIEVFNLLTEESPEFFGGYYYLGLLHKKKDDLVKSLSALKKAVEIEPDFNAGRFELIDIYSQQKSNADIIESCEAILKTEPDNIRAGMYLAIAYLSADQNRTRGEEILAKFGKRVKSDPEILKIVLRYFISLEKYEDAVAALSGMLIGAPENSDILYYAAASHEGMKNDDQAIECLKKIAPDSVYYVEASLHTALYYYHKNMMDTAVGILETSLDNKPESIELTFQLATIFKEMRMFEKSENVFLKGIKQDGDNTKLMYSLGVLYDLWGKKNKSQALMKKVLVLDPTDANALNYLGYSYADMGINLKEAETLIKKALEYKPGDGYITDSLGWVYFKQGNFKKALELLTEAVAKVPNDPVLLEHLGDALVKNDRNGKALEIYKKSLRYMENDTAVINTKIDKLLKKLSFDH